MKEISAETWIYMVIVFAVFVFFLLLILIFRKRGTLANNRKIVDNAPAIVSTAGVFFTFLGVTEGLLGFQTGDIEGSIPTLLDGLKTAFFTSLVGMGGSVALGVIINRLFDKEAENVSDAVTAANIVVKAVKSIEETYKTTANNQNQMYENMARFVGSIDTKLGTIDGKIGTIDDKIDNLNKDVLGINARVANMESVVVAMPKLISDINMIMKDGIGSLDQQVKGIAQLLPKEVNNIQESMVETNNLLEMKFDEFTKLLEKSNTEALVEVMKKVTEEFNKQMKDLINKLVQENFEQLNKSVERLNTWQIENKEMVAELTNRYKQMTVAFGETSNTLQKVGSETEALVGNESKLQALVVALNKVMIDDEKFIEITQNLTASAELTKDTIVKFDDEVSILNAWVRKQRDLVDFVQLLLGKLDEINKINDYSEEFWKKTKMGMNDAINIIRIAAQSLSNNLDDLDGRFYERLNTTLSNLDDCITAVIKNRR